jgi:hypothetical protein
VVFVANNFLNGIKDVGMSNDTFLKGKEWFQTGKILGQMVLRTQTMTRMMMKTRVRRIWAMGTLTAAMSLEMTTHPQGTTRVATAGTMIEGTISKGMVQMVRTSLQANMAANGHDQEEHVGPAIKITISKYQLPRAPYSVNKSARNLRNLQVRRDSKRHFDLFDNSDMELLVSLKKLST